ncbi:MAG: hypothetical protein H7256_14000 [Bdellovibrio sp.]|nr:hypothetical protein [Bdellovibrio sp.]
MNITNEEVTYRIAQLSDVEAVYNFEMKQKFAADDDEMETMMAVWSSSFRKEALEHYFKLGWSFIGSNSKNEVVGFFMGQPLLFFDAQTQTLWIEYVSAKNLTITTELVDIAYRLAREKHFQRVLVPESIQGLNLEKVLPFQKWDRTTSLLKTTK